MRDTGVNEICDLVLGLVLMVKDVVRHVRYLQHLHLLAVAVVLLHLHLNVLRKLEGLVGFVQDGVVYFKNNLF